MHVLYYIDHNLDYADVQIMGVFTSREKADAYATEISKEHTAHAAVELEKRLASQKILEEFLQRNRSAIRHPDHLATSFMNEQAFEKRIKYILTAYIYFTKKLKENPSYNDYRKTLLNFNKLTEPLPVLEDSIPFSAAHPGKLPFNYEFFEIEEAKVDPVPYE